MVQLSSAVNMSNSTSPVHARHAVAVAVAAAAAATEVIVDEVSKRNTHSVTQTGYNFVKS